MKKQKNEKTIYKVFMVFFAVVFVVAVGIMLRNWYVRSQAEKKLEELANQTVTTEIEAVETVADTEAAEEPEVLDANALLAKLEIELPEKNVDFTVLLEENPDIYAWVYIPEIGIDYPVLQHPTDDAYYLEHNLDGSAGLPGTIYTESVNSKDFTDPNTVLYGHNMKNGTMFGALHDLEDGQVFEETQYIYIYTPEQTYVYQIFAAYEYNAIHLIYNFDLTNKEIFQNYLDQIFEIRDMNMHIRDGVEVNADHHIITLSTCVSGQKNKRFLVQGVLLNDPEFYEKNLDLL